MTDQDIEPEDDDAADFGTAPAIVRLLWALPGAVLAEWPHLPSSELRRRVLDVRAAVRAAADVPGWKVDEAFERATGPDGSVWLLDSGNGPSLAGSTEGDA